MLNMLHEPTTAHLLKQVTSRCCARLYWSCVLQHSGLQNIFAALAKQVLPALVTSNALPYLVAGDIVGGSLSQGLLCDDWVQNDLPGCNLAADLEP